MHRSHLSRTQKAFLEDMLENGLSETQAIQKHNIAPRRYRRWIANGLFTYELNLRIDRALRQNKLAMLRSLPKAAAGLSRLTDSQKDETARKTCLDIMAHLLTDSAKAPQQQMQPDDDPPLQISDEKAARMLAILAEKEEKSPSQNSNER